MRYTQPQSGPVQVDPTIGADFAWIAPIGKLVGPSTSNASKTVTRAGIAINSGYAIVSGSIPSLHTTTWTECGVVLLDGVNNVITLSARDTGQAVIISPTNIDLVIWTAADVNIAGTVPTGIVHYVVKRNGSTHTIWLNGRLHGTTSVANAPIAYNGTPAAIGAQAGNTGAGPLTATTGMLSVVRTPRALPDVQCLALSNNHWQLFRSPQRVMLASGAGPVNATGTLTSTLGNATLAASGAVLNAGAFASTLGNATMAAAGSVGTAPSGALASTLADATMSAAGAATNVGSFATSLAGASMSAAGIVINRGAFSATMGDATMAAAGTVAPNVTGTFSSTLDGASMAAYGYNGVPPVLAGFFHRLPKNPRHVQRIP